MVDKTGLELVERVCRAVADLQETREIDAISVCIVRPDGDISTYTAFSVGTKFSLLAAMTIAHKQYLDEHCAPIIEESTKG